MIIKPEVVKAWDDGKRKSGCPSEMIEGKIDQATTVGSLGRAEPVLPPNRRPLPSLMSRMVDLISLREVLRYQ